MSFVMGVAARGMIAWLKSKQCEQLVNQFANEIDKACDEKAGGVSERLQETFVQKITMPINKVLMKENPQRLNTMYEIEQHSIMGGVGSVPEKKTGTNFGPKK